MLDPFLLLLPALAGALPTDVPPVLARELPRPESQRGDLAAKLRGDLASVLAATAPDELVPITIVLAEQASREAIDAAQQTGDKRTRRARVQELLTGVAQRSQADLLALLAVERAAGRAGERIRPLWLHNVVGARVRPALALEIAARPEVAYVNHDAPRGEEVLAHAPLCGPPPPPPAAGAPIECGVNLMGAPQVWSDFGIDGAGVVVGVIDTGLCLTHPDIQNHLWRNPCEIAGNGIDDDANGFVDDLRGWNFESDNADVNDQNGHGSHVAGTVAGDGTGGMRSGMASGVQIMVLKFWNSFSGELSVWESMQYGLANGADVLTASLGWNHGFNPDRTTWRMVCENTIAAGVIVVYAAHNFGCGNPPDNVTTPGDVPDVITVGATDCSDNKAGFSSCGPVTWQGIAPYNDFPYPPGLIKPTIAAPGVQTISHSLCSGYFPLDGTSMATPHVAGAIAMMLQADPTLDQAGVTQILRTTAVDLGVPGNDNEFGSGRVDAYAAVEEALANGNFCEAKQNSCGSLPVISSSGTPSASATSGFVVAGSNARGNQIGILAYTNNGQRFPPLPFGGGLLCVNAPIQRGPTVSSGGTIGLCNGGYSVDMNAFAAGLAGGNPAPYLLIPGTTITCQWWGRDTPQHGVYLTSAMQYAICP